MSLQGPPPDTSGYMVAGYAIFFLISAIYLVSLVVRRRNLEKDLKTLESIEADTRKRPPRGATAGPARGQARGSRQGGAPRRQARKKIIRRK
jgi:hypothetical protein